jgi:hypothetical protein
LRQLNNHGFKHITKGPDRNAYYHEVRFGKARRRRSSFLTANSFYSLCYNMHSVS